MCWLRRVMHDTFEDGIKNWKLPLNHFISTNSRDHVDIVKVIKGCNSIGGPFDPNLLYQAIGGNIRIYNNQYQLHQFTQRLKEAQSLRREAILPTETGGYKLQLAIDEIIRMPTIYNESRQSLPGDATPKR